MSTPQVSWDEPTPQVKWDEPAPAAQPSALSRFGSNFARNIGYSPETGRALAHHPIDTLGQLGKGLVDAQTNLGRQAIGEFKTGDYSHAVPHGIEYLIPGAGPAMAEAGSQFERGDIAGGLGSTAGIAAPMVTPNPFSVAKEGAGVAARGLRAVGERVTPKQLGQGAGGAAGAIGGHGFWSIPGAEVGARYGGKLTERVLGQERANAPLLRPKVAPQVERPMLSPEEWAAKKQPIRGQTPNRIPAGSIPVSEPRTAASTTADIQNAARQDPTLVELEKARRGRSEEIGKKYPAKQMPPEEKQEIVHAPAEKAPSGFYERHGRIASPEEATEAPKKIGSQWPPEAPQVIQRKSGYQSLKDEEAIKEEIGHKAGLQDYTRKRAAGQVSAPKSKGQLVEEAGGSVPSRPVKLTKTPPPGTIVPQTADESIGALNKSLEQAKKKVKGSQKE